MELTKNQKAYEGSMDIFLKGTIPISYLFLLLCQQAFSQDLRSGRETESDFRRNEDELNDHEKN